MLAFDPLLWLVIHCWLVLFYLRQYDERSRDYQDCCCCCCCCFLFYFRQYDERSRYYQSCHCCHCCCCCCCCHCCFILALSRDYQRCCCCCCCCCCFLFYLRRYDERSRDEQNCCCCACFYLFVTDHCLQLEDQIPGNAKDFLGLMFLCHFVEELDDVREVHVTVQDYVPGNKITSNLSWQPLIHIHTTMDNCLSFNSILCYDFCEHFFFIIKHKDDHSRSIHYASNVSI